jgi:CRP/FNR family transcriptional regulator
MQLNRSSIYNLLVAFFQKKEPIQKIKAGSILFQEKDAAQYVYLLLKVSISL